MGNSLPSSSPLTVAIIVVASAGLVLVIYNFVVLRCCSRRETTIASTTHRQMPQNTLSLADHFGQDLPSSSIEDSITELIPAYKFSKDLGLVSQSEDVTCSICLCDFNDGEAIRVLPECLHSFHVPCIDMWLCSHSNCPLCRADTPVHQIVAGFQQPTSIGNINRLPI